MIKEVDNRNSGRTGFNRLTEGQIDSLLSAWLRAEEVPQPIGAFEFDIDDLLQRIDFHGIVGLLYAKLNNFAALPACFHSALRERVVAAEFWEKNHSRLVSNVLGKYTESGIEALIFKGTALAYSAYGEPANRLRGDTDILVKFGKFAAANRDLVSCDFSNLTGNRGNLVSNELSFSTSDASGGSHDIDLHCRLNSSAVLAGLFSFEELFVRSSKLPRLAAGARCVGRVDAMLIACFHRLVHLQSYYFANGETYRSADRLIWIYDIHLLATGFSEKEWRELTRLAHQKALMKVVFDGLSAAQEALKTDIPASVLKEFKSNTDREKPAFYLQANQFQRIIMNISAQDSLRNKFGYIVQLIFPPKDYISAKFEDTPASWLPIQYLAYAIVGISKLGPGRPGKR